MSNLISAFKRVFRAINIFAGIFSTRGSYLTAATLAGDTTVYLENTSDFSSGGGSAHIIDTTNDRDTFTYTGKTNKTLTGCAGVLAHNTGATCIPLVKCIVLDDNVNEMRFFGSRGDGTIEELASIGLKASGVDTIVGSFGSLNDAAGGSRIGIQGNSKQGFGVQGNSTDGFGMQALSTNNYAIYAVSTNSYGVVCVGNNKAQLLLSPGIAVVPTHSAFSGSIYYTSESTPSLFINTTGSATGWKLVGPHLVWEKTITGAAVTSVTTNGEITLDGLTHGGYEFEFVVINSNAGTARYRFYYNNDTTNTNYNFHALYSTAANALGTFGNDALFEASGVGTGQLMIFKGSITITPTGAVMTQSINHVHGVTNMDVYIHKKIATVANLTRIDIVSSVASGIGIDSRFRLWRKK